MNELLTSVFNSSKYPTGTEIDCNIVRYYTFDNREFLELSDVHIKDQKPYPTHLDYMITRTNGNLISMIFNTKENGASALHGSARLINLMWTSDNSRNSLLSNV